jgi:hypothetical protein
VIQTENRQTETPARIAELERIKTALQEALGHAPERLPPTWSAAHRAADTCRDTRDECSNRKPHIAPLALLAGILE